MATYKTRLAGRKTRDLELTQAEAEAMFALGFRFAEFNPEQGRWRLSKPVELLIVRDYDELTIQQP
jgi:hypothetical protein